MKTKKWIAEAQAKSDAKPGALHRQLGIPVKNGISTALLRKIVNAPLGSVINGHKVTRLLKQRANFALNVR